MTDAPSQKSLDEAFYKRADALIELANRQAAADGAAPANASLMFAAARFNAFVSASGFRSGAEMAEKRAETIEYFLGGYRQMLELHLDQYIAHFDAYMKPGG